MRGPYPSSHMRGSTSCWAHTKHGGSQGLRTTARGRGRRGPAASQSGAHAPGRLGRRRGLRCWQPWYDSRLVTGSVLCLLVIQVVREVVVAGLACHHVIVLTPGRSTDPHFPPPPWRTLVADGLCAGACAGVYPLAQNMHKTPRKEGGVHPGDASTTPWCSASLHRCADRRGACSLAITRWRITPPPHGGRRWKTQP